jgi:hypothetical protein
MRAWIELDGEAAGRRSTRTKIAKLRHAGYTVDEYIRGDHCKDLIVRGRQPRASDRHSQTTVATVLPIIISIAALLISGFSYWDQHQSSEAATAERQESQARLVSSIWDSQTSTMTVENLSTTGISAIREVFSITVTTGTSSNDRSYLTTIWYYIFSLVPPCSSLVLTQNSKAVQNIMKQASFGSLPSFRKPKSVINLEKQAISYQATPEFVTFTDAQGVNWTVNPYSSVTGKTQYPIVTIGAINSSVFSLDGYQAIKNNNCQ